MKIITMKSGTLFYDYSKEIKRGAKFLDEVSPGWESKIKPEVLDLNDSYQCVCGQVFLGHFGEGLRALAIWEKEKGKKTVHSAAHYGFDVNDSDINYDNENHGLILYSTLAEQWIAFLVNRNLDRAKSQVAALTSH